MTDVTRVGEARRAAHALATGTAMTAEDIGVLALVVTEAATNLARHARDGVLMLRVVGDVTAPGIEVLAFDKGPGIPDVARAMSDGYSTSTTPGQGLGAIGRLASDLDIYSNSETGTVLVARVWSAARRAAHDGRRWDHGVVCVPIPGETSCGDAWDIDRALERTYVVLADGLGHGVDAAHAATEAIRAVRETKHASPVEAVRAAHRPLQTTRGAALGVASIDARLRRVHFAGVGNIVAAIMSAEGVHHMPSHNGIVGHQLMRVQEFTFAWPQGATLVMHSDGIASRWRLDQYPGLAARDPALLAAALHRDYARGRDDATTIVVRDVEV